MWDDFQPFLVGSGPTSTVLDPDLNPNNILEAALGGSVKVDWSFAGPLTVFCDRQRRLRPDDSAVSSGNYN
jgi:hypothetical protein